MQVLKSSALMICFSLLMVHLGTNAIKLPILAGHYLFDLYATGVDCVSHLAEKWSITGVNNPGQIKYSACMFSAILGGPGVLTVGGQLETTYDSLPSHNIVIYSFRPLVIGNWSPGEYIQIIFDGQSVFSFEPYTITPPIATLPTCGTPSRSYWNSLIQGKFFHSNQNITLTITSGPSNPLAFYGFIDIRMRFINFKTNDQQESCIILPSGSNSLGLPSVCHCGFNQYYNQQTLSCQPCHANCDQCFGPTASDCYVCGVLATYDKNLDACIPCTGNCLICHGPDLNQCNLCIGKITYWNDTCHDTCPSPYISETKTFTICKTPCQPDRYMLWDNNCSDYCNFPLEPRIDGQAKFCDSPCAKGSSQYLFWNGSCQSVCPFFPRSQNGYDFCDACQPNYYMFPNSSCLSSCPFPFKKRSLGGSNFCDFPCKEDSRFYFEKNQSCQPVCAYPYNVRETIFCYLEIPKDIAKNLETKKGVIATTGSFGPLFGGAISLIEVNPATIFVSLFIDILEYIKYLDIRYPPNVQYYFDIKLESPFAVLLNAPPQVVSLLTKNKLYGKFEEDDDLNSSFLVNFWSKIIVLSAITLFIIILCFLSWMTKSYQAFHSFIKKTDTRLRWNFPLTLFVSYYGEIVFYASFEFTTINIDFGLEILSFIICFISKFFLLATFLQSVHIICLNWKFQSKVISGKEIISTQNYLNRYQVIFKESKTGSLSQQAFFCIFAARIVVLITIVVYLPDYPLVQAILITVLSFGMLLYLGITRPVKSVVDLGMYIIQELIMMTAKTCVLVLSIFDSRKIENFNTRHTLGEIIINCFIAFSSTSLLYSALQIFFLLHKSCKVVLNLFVKKGPTQKEERSLDLEQESSDQFKSVDASIKCSGADKVLTQVSCPKIKEKIHRENTVTDQATNREIDEPFEPKIITKRNTKTSKALFKAKKLLSRDGRKVIS